MSETHNSAAAERVSDLTKSSSEQRKSNNEDVITVAAADFNYHSFPSLPSSRPLLRVPWEGRGTAFLLPIAYHTPTHKMWNFVVAMHPLTKTKLWGGTPPLKQESWITVTFGQGKKGIDSLLPWQKLTVIQDSSFWGIVWSLIFAIGGGCVWSTKFHIACIGVW